MTWLPESSGHKECIHYSSIKTICEHKSQGFSSPNSNSQYSYPNSNALVMQLFYFAKARAASNTETSRWIATLWWVSNSESQNILTVANLTLFKQISHYTCRCIRRIIFCFFKGYSIRILNGCEVQIEKSVWHHKACRVMPNSYPE